MVLLWWLISKVLSLIYINLSLLNLLLLFRLLIELRVSKRLSKCVVIIVMLLYLCCLLVLCIIVILIIIGSSIKICNLFRNHWIITVVWKLNLSESSPAFRVLALVLWYVFNLGFMWFELYKIAINRIDYTYLIAFVFVPSIYY